MTNPLLPPQPDLPDFTAIKAEHVEPAIDQLLSYNKSSIEDLLASLNTYTWDNLEAPLEALDDSLSFAWSAVSHLNSVCNTPELRDAYNKCLPKLTTYATELGQHQGLYKAYKALAARDDFANLSIAQRKTINDALQDFTLKGIALPEAEQAQFRELCSELSSLTSRFENNVLDATDAWSKNVSAEQLAGLPEVSLAVARDAAKAKDEDGYRLSLDAPCFIAVMTYSQDRALREEMYTAFVTRASDQGPFAGKWDNSALMVDILKKRLALAKLLGFANFAQRSLVKKMVHEPQQVLQFLQELSDKARPQAQQEFQQLCEFAEQQDGLADLKAWDIAYYSEKLREQEYAISQEALRPYFPEDKVLQGMFALTEKIYGIRCQEEQGIKTWHQDVRFFSLFNQDGSLRAQFYLDLYARAQKRGGAWMDECRVRRRDAEGKLHIPVAFLTCNFTPPSGDNPALFTHDEVVTLFHEFGHGLHHMLTEVDYPAVSGINGVPWDAVELPSQFNEQWCWQRDVLPMISGHFQTGEILPDAMIDKLQAARNFQSAMQMQRQLEFALFDMRIHLETDAAKFTPAFIQQTLDNVRAQVAVVVPPAFNRFQHGFSHIFAGGYAAGYYSYKWAEVLASDAFARFEEEGLFNPAIGQAFLNCILSRGGAEEPLALFKEFRGREPNIDALLKHNGIL